MRWSLEPVGEVAKILSEPHPSPGRYPFERIFGAQPLNNEWSKRGTLIQLLLGICATFDPGGRMPFDYSQDEALVNQALLYLSQYYAQNIRVDEVAHSLNVSYRHLARIFKSVTGQTVIQKLNAIRLEEARRLLAETNMPVGEIGKQVGFTNEYYFSAIFKQVIATTPTQYRAMMKSR
ncbi:MAG: helix-turn-helix transcriptional regulator [Clostridia bacterium]